MAKVAVSRKQLLNEPDRFMTFSSKMVNYAKSHLKMILICLGVIVVALLSFTAVSQISSRNESLASQRVEKAVEKYTSALKDTDPKAAYNQVKNDFTEIFKAYDSRNAVKFARIIYGDISFKAGDADTAIEMYTRAKEDFSQSPAILNIILSDLGHAYLLKKEYPRAIHFFKMISDGKEKTMQSDALFNLAWLYENSGDKDRSLAMYKRMLDEFPDTMYGELIKEKVSG